VACGQVITQDTTLENDLDCQYVDGVVIGAPGITLDLGGHTVHSWATAIRNDGYDGVTIENGTVVVDNVGVGITGADRNVVRNVSAWGLQKAIVLSASDRNRIVDNDLVGVGVIVDDGSDANVLRGNSVRAYEGFVDVHGSGNRVVENVVASREGYALALRGDHNRAARNTLSSTSSWVVEIVDAADDQLLDNAISGDPTDPHVLGIGVVRASRSLVAHNIVTAVAGGARLASGQDNVLRANSAAGGVSGEGLPEDGFVVEAATAGASLERNTATGFLDDGFDVEAPGTRLRRNTANDNGDFGIEAVQGVIDLGGNRASGNGNPLQCLNVVCR
jgi:hypothetical protein